MPHKCMLPGCGTVSCWMAGAHALKGQSPARRSAPGRRCGSWHSRAVHAPTAAEWQQHSRRLPQARAADLAGAQVEAGAGGGQGRHVGSVLPQQVVCRARGLRRGAGAIQAAGPQHGGDRAAGGGGLHGAEQGVAAGIPGGGDQVGIAGRCVGSWQLVLRVPQVLQEVVDVAPAAAQGAVCTARGMTALVQKGTATDRSAARMYLSAATRPSQAKAR